jgi:hypothetical protein
MSDKVFSMKHCTNLLVTRHVTSNFDVVTPCGLIGRDQRFGETYPEAGDSVFCETLISDDKSAWRDNQHRSSTSISSVP